jgi:biopolymer transport protein ExbD
MKNSRHGRRVLRRHRQTAAPPGLLNLTSMIDIFTVLLFFLLVYAAELAIFTPMSVLKLSMPAAQAETVVPETPLQLEIVVRKDLIELFRNGSSFLRTGYGPHGAGLESLAQALQQLKQQSPATRELILRPEPDVAYEVLVQVMDAARSGRITTSPGSPAGGAQELFPDIFMGVAPAPARP